LVSRPRPRALNGRCRQSGSPLTAPEIPRTDWASCRTRGPEESCGFCGSSLYPLLPYLMAGQSPCIGRAWHTRPLWFGFLGCKGKPGTARGMPIRREARSLGRPEVPPSRDGVFVSVAGRNRPNRSRQAALSRGSRESPISCPSGSRDRTSSGECPGSGGSETARHVCVTGSGSDRIAGSIGP
jgi:hypothetical protein